MNKRVLLCAGLLIGLAGLAACGSHSKPALTSAALPIAVSFQSIDLKPGTGIAVVNGQIAEVHYTGWLYDPAAPGNKGKKFDSSRDHGQPFSFPLGTGQVIKGWDQGIVGMKVGGQRRLIVPPDLGYGDKGADDAIPPNATLLFEVELLSFK